MSYLELFDAEHKKQNKGYFIQLINVALADGIISPKEEKLLYRLGHKLGFVDEEIHKIIENPGKSVYNPPYELAKRMEQIYEVVRMIIADEQITKEEIHLASCIAVASGFNSSEAGKVVDLVINGIQAGKDEEEILKDYLKLKK